MADEMSENMGAPADAAEIIRAAAGYRAARAAARPVEPAQGPSVRVRACLAQSGKRWSVAGGVGWTDLDARSTAADVLDVTSDAPVTFSWLVATVPLPTEAEVEATVEEDPS